MKRLPLILLLLPVCLFAQNRFDVVIDEIMPDPAPQVGLSNNEWVELKNTSAIPVDIGGWRLVDISGPGGPMPAFILQPDSFVVICSAGAAAALSAFGTTIAVTGFPSLDNNGEQLFLENKEGRVIHAVEYSSSWFDNDIKKEGGWSLEMIDPKNPCTGRDNWTASTGANGGTPGQKNAVDATLTDNNPPQLKNAFLANDRTVILAFDEPLDSSSGATIGHYKIDGGAVINGAVTLAPLFNSVQLTLGAPLSNNAVYNITAGNISDCKGNSMAYATIKAAIPANAAAADLVINEILFNPRSNGYDYVEVYNKSNKVLDASKIYIANRNGNGVISSPKILTTTPFYIYPGDYLVATDDAESLQLNYLVKNADKIVVVSPMPALPDAGGDVVILNIQGEITDEVRYNKDWHFKLIDNDESVALERVNPNGPSQDATNWHSAAATAGYGTPTYANSQLKQINDIDAAIAISPTVFSPDNDGRDDIATIQYQLNEPGYVANITIFDAGGRPVRVLVNNGTMALTGYWNWDGLNDKDAKLPAGTYIIYTEIFNLQGRKKHFKNAIVLARKWN